MKKRADRKIRPEKTAILKEIRSSAEAAGFVLFVNCRGMKSEQMTDLRRQMRHSGGRLQVVKNTLLAKTAAELGWGDISAFLEGPTAMIAGKGDPTAVVKVLDGYIRDNGLPLIKGGMLEKRKLSSSDIGDIALIPPREILLAVFVGTVAAPMTRLAGVMNQKVLSLLYALKAIEKKKGG